MPLVYQQNINGETKIGVWHITEEESFFLNVVSVQKEISHPHKRLQHLAGRLLLSILYPDFPVDQISITSSGKPVLSCGSFHFSISHCGNYAAAIISENARVGIDVEMLYDKITNIENKFTSKEEKSLIENESFSNIQILTLIWSIKEAMFKWHGEGSVDFKRHLIIEEMSVSNEKILTRCSFTKNGVVKLMAESRKIEDCILSYVIALD